MRRPTPTHAGYEHGVLVHDTDDELVAGTRAFVEEGLASGADVMVHGTRDRVELLRAVLGDHPRLEYGFDEELYRRPSTTLFAYQRRLAERSGPTELWVTGTVPLGGDPAAQAAWNRYECSVDVALGSYPFRALCVYDTRTRPAAVIAAARATHATVGVGATGAASREYVDPVTFLADPLAMVPAPPTSPPSATTAVRHLEDLAEGRRLLAACARSDSAVPSETIERFLLAVHEVSANGLVHGAPPVHISLWTYVGALTCLVEDHGTGDLDPMTGFRYPDDWGPMGLWAARQLVDDLFITTRPAGGCGVLLTSS